MKIFPLVMSPNDIALLESAERRNKRHIELMELIKFVRENPQNVGDVVILSPTREISRKNWKFLSNQLQECTVTREVFDDCFAVRVAKKKL